MEAAAIKRVVAMVLGAATLLLNRKLGLQLDDTDLSLFEGLITAYILQSAWKETALAKIDAAKSVAVTDAKSALDVVKEATKEPPK